jgi:LPS-assembly protein
MTDAMIAPLRTLATLSAILLLPALVQAATPACAPPLPGMLAAAGAAPAPAAAAPPAPPALPTLPTLPEDIRFSAEGPDAFLNTDAEGNFDLGGEVTFSVGRRELRGRHLRYNAATRDYRLTGTVSYSDANVHVSGDAGNYEDGAASFSNAQFEMLHQPGRGRAQSIAMTRADVIDLDNVVYTTCPEGAADWELRARRISLYTKTLRGIGHGTRVRFKGVTLIYLPWISFPLSNARQSGFLFPTIGSSGSNGATLAVPYYWNIAPNQDLTFTPRMLSRRGIELGEEFRMLLPKARGTLAVNYLPDDRVARADRSWEKAEIAATLPRLWLARLHAENVSDIRYFEDFGDGPQATSTTFLRRDLQLALRNDVWRLGAQLLQFQTLLPDCQPLPAAVACLAQGDRPYAQLPRFTASARWLGSSGLGTWFESELVDYQRSDSVRGWRAHVQPGLGVDYIRPGFYLKPRANWDLTAYRLSPYQLPGGAAGNTSPSRSLPVITLDTALQLERRAGATRFMTLEPRLLYVYIPVRDQAELPVFDSGVPDPNFVSLFRANRYVGLDRLGDANELTAGVTMHMLQASTGQRYLSATLGQTLHFSTPHVALPGETVDTRKRSDLIATLDLTAYRDWSLHYDLAWNPALAQTDKSLLSMQFRPADARGRVGNRVVNVGYRYTRGSITQAEGSVAWPVARRWDIYGRSVYSFRDRHAIDNFAGVQYHADCWGLRVVARDSVSNRNGMRETGWYLQLELKGLSSVGSGADSFLQGAIQGYSPTSTNH